MAGQRERPEQKIANDRSLTAYQRRCYALLLNVPSGKVVSYGDLAKALKNTGARAVGRCVGANPYAPEVPCHRVVRSDGKLGGYSGGINKKIKLLRSEGIEVKGGQIDGFQEKRHRFN